MCIIDGNVKIVSATKIFVGKMANHKQLTVYRNQVSAKKATMLLPFKGKSISFLDLSVNKYPIPYYDLNNIEESNQIEISSINNIKNDDFFEEIAGCCNSLFVLDRVIKTNSISPTRSIPKYVDVGSYNCAIVNSLEGLNNINDDFKISQGAIKFINDNYNNDFSFLACKIKDGEHLYHPIAYITDIDNKEMFIPTLHYHGENSDPDWDHSIFIWNSTAIPKDLVRYSKTFNIKSNNLHIDKAKSFENKFNLESIDNIVNIKLKNNYNQNHDIVVV